MESYGIYKAASRFFDTHAMLFFKVVSDHFEPLHVSKELAIELILKNIDSLKKIIHAAKFVTKQNELFTQKEKELIQAISSHLTKSQSDAFYDACCYYKLHHKKPLNIETPSYEKLSKKERSHYLESLIKTLTL
jgi:hypothetical protein